MAQARAEEVARRAMHEQVWSLSHHSSSAPDSLMPYFFVSVS